MATAEDESAAAVEDPLLSVLKEIRALAAGQNEIKHHILQLLGSSSAPTPRAGAGSVAVNGAQQNGTNSGSLHDGKDGSLKLSRFTSAARGSQSTLASATSQPLVRMASGVSGGHSHRIRGSYRVSRRSGRSSRYSQVPSMWEEEDLEVELHEALPRNWPASVGLREEFTVNAAPPERSVFSGKSMVEKVLTSKRKSVAAGSAFQGKLQRGVDIGMLTRGASASLQQARMWVLDPASGGVVVIDVAAMFVLLYELLVTPYMLSWRIEMDGIWRVFSYVTCLYWMIDLCMGFIVGYFDKTGCLVMKQPMVARHYMATWFSSDLVLLVADIAIILLTLVDTTPFFYVRPLKTLRLLKLLRLTRLLRLFNKFSTFNLGSSGRHEGKLFMSILKAFGFTMLMNHVLSCFWFAIGVEAPSDTQKNWVSLFREENGLDRDEGDPLWEYVSSFHWTLAQLTLGSHEVAPSNSFERVFTIMLMVFGLLYGSTIISIFSAQIVQFIVLKQDRAEMMHKLKRYLWRQHLQQKLVTQVLQQASQRSLEPPPPHEDDVEALKLLSESLRNELRKAIRMPDLLLHPLFQVWARMSDDAANQLCCNGLTERLLSESDDLFLPLHTSIMAFFLSSGRMHYEPMKGKAFRKPQDIEEKAWLCEAALWCSWIHVGTARALSDCALFAMTPQGLLDILSKFRLVAGITSQYGRNYHARVVAAVPPFVPHLPDDIGVPECNRAALLSQEVGLGLLERARERGDIALTEQQYIGLEQELRDGKCTLEYVPGSGVVRRIVSVVVVCLHHDDMILVQVGTIDRGHSRIHCQLPGVKLATGELSATALKRIFANELKLFAGETSVSAARTVHTTVTTESATFGIKTLYCRTEFHMDLKCNDPISRITPLQEDRGPVVTMQGREVELDIRVMQNDTQAYLCTWVQEDDLQDMNLTANVEAIQQWVTENLLGGGAKLDMITGMSHV